MKQQKAISEKMIRLHVVAQSDSETDQANKLQVRDRVLSATEAYLAEASTADQAVQCLSPHLTQLELEAEQCLEELGAKADVSVTLEREQMHTRFYETFTLPAGAYTSLRVTIGEGEGRNWWCVVFPSLCTAATVEEFEQYAVQVGLTQSDIRWITDESMEVRVRFQILEWLQKLKEWIT